MAWPQVSDRMLRTTLAVFGEQVTYRRGAATQTISKAVFDANYQGVDQNTGAIVTSTGPMLGVRTADLPDSEARDGDEVTVRGVVYRVIDRQPDSEGHTKLILHRKT